MHFTVSGKGLNEAAVARAVQLSHEKYCSASAMLSASAQMSTAYDIVETAGSSQ
jgi:putative redox protein